MQFDERRVSEIVERVVRELMSDGTGPVGGDRLVHGSQYRPSGGEGGSWRFGASASGGSGGGRIGLYDTPEEAIAAAQAGQRELRKAGIAMRKRVVDVIRQVSIANAEAWGRHAREETGMGRASDKKVKNENTARFTPGVEDLDRRLFKGDLGVHIVDGVPWGVICAITPSTNPTATVINNAMTMIAAGNAVVFCPHPSAKECTIRTMTELNAAIVAQGGPRDLMTCVTDPTLKAASAIMNSPEIKVIAATGGPGVVRAAFEAKKKVFTAGPGNPPCLVDATADLDRAGRMTVKGASFDNNLPCVSEKVAIAEAGVIDEYIRAMGRHGAHILSSREIEALLPVVLDGEHPRKESIGQDAGELLRRAGISGGGEPLLLVAQLERDHPLVIHEQMMPFLPVVSVPSFEAGLELAVEVEHGFGHTSILWSRNTDHITEFTEQVQTTIQVINGPSYAWSGDEGEGYATMTVTTPTGEGITSPRTWQRKRHLIYSGMLQS